MDNKCEVGGDEEKMMENNNNNNDDDDDEKEKEKEKEKLSEVVISIEKMLWEVSHTDLDCFIYKVPKGHRKMNESAYTPQMISIGPYHNGRPELKAAEEYKLWALKRYLTRVNMSVMEAMNMTLLWEQKARSCYGHHIQMNKQQFARMMLLDGCFILEFMTLLRHRINEPYFLREQPDHVEEEDYTYYFLTITGISSDLLRDLTMVENQLPFFVLLELFNIIICKKNILVEAVQDQLLSYWGRFFYQEINSVRYRFPFSEITEVRHLVDLLKMYFIPSPDTEEYNIFDRLKSRTHYMKFPTITKLYETGVKVQVTHQAKSLMDFSFKDGIFKIPHFTISSDSEIHFQNLIVSEMLIRRKETHGMAAYVFHYLALLDDLIKTEKDVSILVKEYILFNNTGGSDKQVPKIINNLHISAPTFQGPFYYYYMWMAVNDYRYTFRAQCRASLNRSMASVRRYMAILRRDYFNTPWAFISFLAATVLLILTFLQTLFSTPLIFHK